uniref:Ubinuclein 2 n=1 Tax=Callorhinchus milii TaxID=7868 RepID=A0A4W3GDE5_CALMI
MAEPRRVAFSTLTSPGPAPAPGTATPPAAPARKKRREERGANGNVRLQLSLSEPSDRSSTEYSYSELLREARVRPEGHLGINPLCSKNSANADDPFNAEEKERKEVEALAKKFEEKYGQKNHKRRKDRMQDLIDMGYGYDETDPFIDNSEAYDELVPASLTTKYGGFYINAGTLQFRQTSDTEDEDGKFKDGEDRISKKQKRRDESGMKDKKPKKLKVSKESGVVALNASKVSKKKRRNHSDSLSLAEMLRKFQKEKDSMKKQEVGLKPTPGPQQPDQTPKNASLSDSLMPTNDPLLSMLGTSSEHDLLRDASTAIDLLADLDIEKLLAETPSGSPISEPEESSSAGASSPAGSLLHTPRDVAETPEGLPTPLEKRIGDLKMVRAPLSPPPPGEGKKKFFTSDINAILLDIELQVQELSLNVRTGVYAYLVSFMPCSKDALMKRLKKLHLNEQMDRTLAVLKSICLVVSAWTRWRLWCFLRPLFTHWLACVFRTVSEEERDKNGSEDEDEEKPGRRVTGPRKKFAWNDHVRELLCNLVKIKLGCYELEPNKLQSVEDYLKTFLETEVKPIWPKGWMQSRLLFKESKRVHNHLTDSSPKRETKLSPPLGSGSKQLVSVSPQGGVCASGRETICLDDSLDEELPLKPPSLESVSEALALFTSSAKGTKETLNCVNPASAKTPAPPSTAPLSFMFSHGGTGAKKPQEGVRQGLSSLIAGYTAPSPQGTHKAPVGGSGVKQQQQQHNQARPSQTTGSAQTVKPQPGPRHPVFHSSSPLPVGKCHANPVVKLSACPLHVIANHTQKASEKQTSLQPGFPQSVTSSISHSLVSRASPGPSTSSAYKAAATSSNTSSMQGFKPAFTSAKAVSSPGCAGLGGQSGLAVSLGNRQASGKHTVSPSLARQSAPGHQQPGNLVKKPSVPQKLPGPLGPGGGGGSRSIVPPGGVRGSSTAGTGRSGGPGITAVTASRSGATSKSTVSTSTGSTNRSPLNRSVGLNHGPVSRTVAGGAISRTSVSVATGTTGAIKMLPSPHRTSSATSSSAMLASTPPLTLMTSPLNVTSPNVSSASLNTAAFGMLGGLVPVSLPFQFPLNLISFGADSSNTASASTGSTSAAFHHNLTQSECPHQPDSHSRP